jgi:hypothetical protein
MDGNASEEGSETMARGGRIEAGSGSGDTREDRIRGKRRRGRRSRRGGWRRTRTGRPR